MKVLAVLLISVCFCSSNPIDNEPVVVPAETSLIRLSENIKPSSYVIELTLADGFETKKTFTGKVTITFKVGADEATEFKLHKAKEIELVTCLLNGETVTVNTDTDYDETSELIKFTLPDKTKKDYTFVIDYNGVLYDDTVMSGFYLSSYKVGDTTKYVAATQFEATNARKAFPCFDEPSFKATFTITINHPEGYTAIGNQPSSGDPTDKKKTIFKTTPAMSTYLVAFVVSEFVSITATGETRMSIYYGENTPADWLNYARDTSPDIQKHLSSYTNIDYWSTDMKQEQLLQVAIPDFGPGAMENWGLVTYRDVLLFFSDKCTARDERKVTSTIAHEFAHMWFGDLVTTKWWDTIWLNEGFATFFEMEASHAVRSDFQMENQFVLEELQSVLVQDGVKGQQALNDEAQTATGIRAKFSDITYSKGGSIIRMMNHIMGADKFKAGLQKYLNTNKGGSVTPEELFVALEVQVSGITEIMKNWINNPGYPVITVNRTDDKNIKLSQERFLYDESDKTSTWKIPISYTMKSKPDFTSTGPLVQLDVESMDVPLETKSDDWIILNVQQTGYYRVNYDEKLWKNIKNALKDKEFGKIENINRAQIIDDIFNLARADKVDYELALDISKYLEKETDYFPWYSAFSSFSFLRKRFASGELNKKVTKHVSNMMRDVYKDVNFDKIPTEHIGKMKTSLALQWACTVNHEDCQKDAQKLFDSYIKGGPEPKPDVRQTVYCEGVKQSVENWEALLVKLKEATVPSEIYDMLKALGCTNDKATQEKYLEMSIESTSIIRPQDANTVFQAVLSGTPEGVDACLDFVVKNAADIEKVYGGLTKVVMALSDCLTTQDQVNTFIKCLDTNPPSVTPENINIAKTNANNNLEWIAKHQPTLESYFGAAGIFAPNMLLTLFVIIAAVFKNL